MSGREGRVGTMVIERIDQHRKFRRIRMML